ncbi:MAG TPA: hypothetical protein VI603_15855 [Saprospiraceae bacterium]|nr:hypothetical protein [Saprospiraceae bacterium]
MNNPFQFEKKRDFGSVITDSLYFFTRNFKSFLLGFLMYIGPFFLIGALGMIYAGLKFPDLLRNDVPGLEMFIGLIVFVPFIILASLMMIAFVCAMVQKFQREPGQPLIEGIWPDIRKNLWPAAMVFITLFLLLIVPYVLIIVLAFTVGADVGIALFILLSIPVLFYLIVPFTIFMIAHILEKNTVSMSMRRAFFLVRDKWWSTFGIYLVISILASLASYIFMIPAYIIFFVQTLGSLGTGEISTEFGLWFGIMYACGFLGSLFAGMYQILGMILQYYNLREQKEGIGLLRRIQDVDKPAGETYV